MVEKEAEKNLKMQSMKLLMKDFSLTRFFFQIVAKALNEYRKGHKSEKDDN